MKTGFGLGLLLSFAVGGCNTSSPSSSSLDLVHTQSDEPADAADASANRGMTEGTDGGESKPAMADGAESASERPPEPSIECCGCVDWVVSATGPTAVGAADLAVADDGSTTLLGILADSAVFGDIELTGHGIIEGFVARLDERGHFVWASAFDSSGFNSPLDVSLALGPDDSLRVAGNLREPTIFGGGSDQETVFTDQAFVAEFTSSGEFSRISGPQSSDRVYHRDVGVAADGSVFVVGDMNGTATFGAGQDTEVVRDVSANTSFFGASYDSSGALRWVVGPSGAPLTGQTRAGGLDVSPDGELVVTGMFMDICPGQVTLGEGTAQATSLRGSGSGAAFVARYEAGGQLAWAKQSLPVSRGIEYADVCVGLDGQSYGNAVSFSSDGSVLATGVIAGGLFTFGAGEPNEVTLDSATGWLARWNEDGTLAWATACGGWPFKITETSDGSIWIAGMLPEGSQVFGPGEANETVIEVPAWERPDVGSGINVDAFVARFDSAGKFLCAWHPGPSEMAHRVWGLDAHPDGGVVISGDFEGTVDFGTATDPRPLTAEGGMSAFVAKLLP